MSNGESETCSLNAQTSGERVVGSAPAVDPERAVGVSQQQERRSLRAACCRILTWEVRLGLVTDSLMVEVESGMRISASCVHTGRQRPARPRWGHFPGAHILCHLMVMLGHRQQPGPCQPHRLIFVHLTVQHLLGTYHCVLSAVTGMQK